MMQRDAGDSPDQSLQQPASALCAKAAARFLLAVFAGGVAGCGIVQLERTIFPNQAVDGDGNLLFFEDLTDITTDDDLTPEDMADALSELGLQSQELIDGIVEDGLVDDGAPVNDNTNSNANANRNDNAG